MDDNPEKQLMEKQLMEKIKYCQKTARNLKKEYESLLQKQKSTNTTDDSDKSVTTPLANDVTKRLKDIDLALESNRQQLKLALELYLTTQSDLSTSKDHLMIQSDDTKMCDAKVKINQQVKLSDDDNGQNEVKLNQIVQTLFTGTLPDDFFLHLMSVMGIQECLLSNRLVCLFWNELVLERCSNQKSLKLFETFDVLMKYGEHLLEYEKTDDASLILKSIGDDLLFEGLGIDHKELVKSLHQEVEDDSDDDTEECKIQTEMPTREKKLESSKILTALFPKVDELVLCATEGETLINIEHLLQFYAKQLTSLTMTLSMTYFDGLYESPSSILRAFTFPKLKSLNTFNFSPEDYHLLSLLPQLESLTMELAEMSLETLLRTGTQLRELNIDSIRYVYTAPEEDEFAKRPPISSNLRKFSFDSTVNALQTLEFISLNLTSLECLKLSLYSYLDIFHSMTSNLALLQQLHSLTLKTAFSFFLLDDNQLAQIQPLPSVRHLKLLLRGFYSFSMVRFSKSLFATFPNVEQILIAFVGNVDAATLAAFEAFAGKHPNVVQLFRSKNMSKFTNLPNAVAPLLGNHRQVYEEYIQEEELFGVNICKLTASLIMRQGEDGPNLKNALRPADRLAAMSNLLQLLQSKAFAFTDDKVDTMIEQMVDCALKYGPSEGALFMVTSKCVLFLLGYRVVEGHDPYGREKPFLDTRYYQVYPFSVKLVKLVKHYTTQQYNDKELLLQLCKQTVELLTKFASIRDDDDDYLNDVLFNEEFDDFKMWFKILLKLASYYQTEQLNVLENEEKLLLQMYNLIDHQLKKFESEKRLNEVIIKCIRSKDRVYRVEMVRALLRCCESTDGYFNLLSGEADGDSSEGDSSDSDTSDGSSAEDEPEL